MENRKKIALLIDYDNFSKEEYFPILKDELNEFGDVLVKYGFYSNFGDSTIKEKFIRLGIEPIAQIPYSNKKNASDIRMSIEAMDLLEKDFIDCFCLATNDSDFTPLVIRLKKSNKYVVGAGNNLASENFINACDAFISVEKIIESKEKKDNEKNQYNDLIKTIDSIIDSNKDEKGMAVFSAVIQSLKEKMKDFSPKNYGSTNKQVLPFFQNALSNSYNIVSINTDYFISKKKRV